MIRRISFLLLIVFSLVASMAKADSWAIKSNLLYDTFGAPNIGVEYGWKGHWSISTDITTPWWVDDDNEWCYEMINAGIEARYWINDWTDTPLKGHFLGLYGNGGCFDFGHDRMGWQSQWFWTTGVSYGYNFKLSSHLRMECTIGIGFLNTDYTRYNTTEDNSSIYLVEEGNYNWFGPTKAGVSLIWVF